MSTEYLKVHDHNDTDEESGTQSGTEATESGGRCDCLGWCSVAIVCGLLGAFVIFGIIKTVSAFQVGTCGQPAAILGPLLPPQHVIRTEPWQKLRGLFLWEESDVYDPAVSNTTRIGDWRDASFFGLYTTLAYEANGETLVVARPTIFKLFGKEYTLYRCGSDAPNFLVTEDYWAEPWFQFFSKTMLFKLYEGDRFVGTAAHSLTFKGWEPASWSAVIKDPNGTEIAILSQHFDGWFFSPSVWSITNTRPDVLPTYAVSFLAAAYDLAKSSSSSRSSSGSKSGKR